VVWSCRRNLHLEGSFENLEGSKLSTRGRWSSGNPGPWCLRPWSRLSSPAAGWLVPYVLYHSELSFLVLVIVSISVNKLHGVSLSNPRSRVSCLFEETDSRGRGCHSDVTALRYCIYIQYIPYKCGGWPKTQLPEAQIVHHNYRTNKKHMISSRPLSMHPSCNRLKFRVQGIH
jgi:hypothetical protein